MSQKKVFYAAVILLVVNTIAFCANYFKICPHFTTTHRNVETDVYLLTDAEISTHLKSEPITSFRFSKNFWPFVQYYTHSTENDIIKGRFRGFFADFSLSEYLFYNGMILLIVGFLKIW